jgi:hypothetical protein
MPSTFTLFNSAAGKIGDGTIDLDTHTFKVALTNSAPIATNTVLANITQISGTFGYTTGGATLGSLAFTQPSAGVWRWDTADFSFTASGGTMGTFRYLVIYSDTAASDDLVGYYDHGTAVSLPDGSSYSFTVAADGHFEITKTP